MSYPSIWLTVASGESVVTTIEEGRGVRVVAMKSKACVEEGRCAVYIEVSVVRIDPLHVVPINIAPTRL